MLTRYAIDALKFLPQDDYVSIIWLSREQLSKAHPDLTKTEQDVVLGALEAEWDELHPLQYHVDAVIEERGKG